MWKLNDVPVWFPKDNDERRVYYYSTVTFFYTRIKDLDRSNYIAQWAYAPRGRLKCVTSIESETLLKLGNGMSRVETLRQENMSATVYSRASNRHRGVAETNCADATAETTAARIDSVPKVISFMLQSASHH